MLVIRASGATGLDVALRGGIKVDDKPDNPATTAAAAAGTEERRYVIQEQGEVTLRGIGDPVVWSFQAIPDRAPTIALTKDPEPQLRGSLMLNYKIEDDYGVTEARANFALKPQSATQLGTKPPASRPRARFTARPTCRWCCRRRAPAAASARRCAICPNIPGPAPRSR